MEKIIRDEYDDKWDKLTDENGDTFWENKETNQVFKTDISLSGALLNDTIGEEVTEEFHKDHPEEE
jgi:hypothetical protein